MTSIKQVVRWPRSWKRRLIFSGVYLLFLVGLGWGGCRLYWKLKFDVPLTSSASVWDYFFPEIRRSGVLDANIKPDDEFLDVLMLGASTIESGWGNVEGILRSKLKLEFGDSIRIFNLATIAHTSRDSALKSKHLADKAFDLTIVYDGFNDCRMNNCSSDLFQNDYSHCARYRSFERRRVAGTIILPPELNQTLERTIGLGAPDTNLLQFGSDLKTPQPFRNNLESILEVAHQQRGLVILNTFAFHIPDGYSDEKLKRGELDFGSRAGSNRCPLQMWGRQSDVVSCVRAHNQVIKDLAKQQIQEVVLVDQARLLSDDGKNFTDVCHFTDLGCQRFVANLMDQVVPRLKSRWKSSTDRRNASRQSE